MKKALIVIDLQNDYFCNGNMGLNEKNGRVNSYFFL